MTDDQVKEVSSILTAKLQELGQGGHFILIFETEKNAEGNAGIGICSTTPPEMTKDILDMMVDKGDLSNPRLIDNRKGSQN